MSKTKPAPAKTEIENKFSKKQLLAAKRFEGKRDVLNAVLANFPDNAEFTVKDVEERINIFMKGKVK